jgi:putative membrane protein
MTRSLAVALAITAALALASCAGTPDTPEFVRKAAMGDLYEIAAGKIASERGQSEAVKQFGLHKAEMHGKTLEELRRIVEAEKLDIALPGRLSQRYHTLIVELTEAKAEDFDEVYARQQASVHKKAVGLFDAYAEEGNNPALKQFAANVLPAIKQDLLEAEKLAP